MREMKDSGIEWIGEIPLDWQAIKLKFVMDNFDYERIPVDSTKRSQDGEQLYDYYGASGVIDQIDGYTSEGERILIGEDGANLLLRNLPVIYIANGKYWVNNHAHILKPKGNGNLHFFANQMECIDYTEYITGSAQPKLSQSNLGQVWLVVPPVEEQNLISAYLDSKCAEIDALTTDIQSQIDTLEQYKRSVITEAVTKGLNRDVEMKESGIPFIGAIPVHWKSDKLKYHLQRNEPRNPGEQEVLSLYRDYGIVPKDSRDDNFNVTSEDTTNYKYVRVGDFVINKMKAWQGSVAVSDYEGIVSPAYYVYKFTDDNIYRRYFHYLLRACYKDEFMRLSGGIRVGQWDLSATALENTYILLPPYEEQVRIADYLDDKKKDIDDVIASKHDQLATLDACKKSTIYEYVTGKKEVTAV